MFDGIVFSNIYMSRHNKMDSIKIFFFSGFFLCHGASANSCPEPSHCSGFTITITHHTRWDSSGRVIGSSQDLYLIMHNTHKNTSIPPAGFEPTIPGSERPQTHAWDRVTTGTGFLRVSQCKTLCQLVSPLLTNRPTYLLYLNLNSRNFSINKKYKYKPELFGR